VTEAARSQPSESDPGTLGIICGGGAFPVVVAEAALKAGRNVFLLPIHGFAEPAAVARYPHEWIHIGAFGKLSSVLKRNGCRQVVFVGTVLRPSIRKLRVDWGSLKLLPRVLGMFRGGDDHLLSAVGRIFEENGFQLVGAHEIAPDILVPAGVLEFGRIDARKAYGVVHVRVAVIVMARSLSVVPTVRPVMVPKSTTSPGPNVRLAELQMNRMLPMSTALTFVAGLLLMPPEPST